MIRLGMAGTYATGDAARVDVAVESRGEDGWSACGYHKGCVVLSKKEEEVFHLDASTTRALIGLLDAALRELDR